MSVLISVVTYEFYIIINVYNIIDAIKLIVFISGELANNERTKIFPVDPLNMF